jgi:D-alanine-D-alanine ligase
VKVAIVHDRIGESARVDERDALLQAELVARLLAEAGHASVRLEASSDLDALRARLRAEQPALVVNLVESLDGVAERIHWVPRWLEAAGLPFTGGSSAAIRATSNKLEAKRRLRAAGLATPDWVEPGGQAPEAPRRWILKPVWEDASIAIDDGAVVEAGGAALLRAIGERARAVGRSVFAEAYVDGRDFNVGLLAKPGGFEALPPMEVTFERWPEGKPRIYGFAAKWDPASLEWDRTDHDYGLASREPELAARLEALARDCAAAFGLSGYARVDFRVDASGAPFVLELNSNPCLSPDSGFLEAAALRNLSPRDALARIVAAALARAEEASAAGEPSWREDVRPGDLAALRRLCTEAGVFADAEIELAVSLAEDALARGAEESGHHFWLAERGSTPLGYACYGPIDGARGSFDLYWIVVGAAGQGRGLGRRLLAAVEARAVAQGGRRLYAETSGRSDYAPTRAFYERTGFVAEATLADFYAPGEAKVIYAKALGGSATSPAPAAASCRSGPRRR